MELYGIFGVSGNVVGLAVDRLFYDVTLTFRELATMPFMLLALFVIALLITLAGFFLSSRTPASHPQSDYIVTPGGRRIVESTTVPARAHRQDMRTRDTGRTRVYAERSSSGVSVARSRAVINRSYVSIDRAYAGRGGASVVNEGFWEPFAGRINSWKILLPGLVTVFLLGLYLVSVTLPNEVAWTSPWFAQANTQPASQSKTQNNPVSAASQRLDRVYQLALTQYKSASEYNIWAPSACSAAAMTEVINSYGHHYRITDILKVESQIGEITPQEGLLEEVGIQRTATKFGFKTTWGDNVLSLNQLIAAANRGTPVIVSFPPSTFAGGHILVVRGGNSNYVYLADSSRLDWTELTHARFMQFWRGFSAIVTPA